MSRKSKSFAPKPPPAGRNKFDQKKEPTVTITGKKADFVIVDDVVDPPGNLTTAIMVDQIKRAQAQIYGSMFTDLASSYYGTGRAEPSPQGEAERAYKAARPAVEKYLHKATTHSTAWADVIGNERARTALLEAIEHPHQHKDIHAHYGIKAPKGVLLYGPPGCGKTMFAKAAASALAKLYGSDTELLIVNGTEIQSGWVGETEEAIRAIFAFARAYHAFKGHPLVLFIDEADAILPDRNSGYRFEASNVATFLTEMDGMNASGAFVILATNRPEAIDEAVLRDGRIDRRIKVERPTQPDALLIAANALAMAPVQGASTHDLVDYLYDPAHLLRPLTNSQTGSTHHFLLAHIVSGAMVVALVERAKGIAMRRDMAEIAKGYKGPLGGITPTDLRQAVDDAFAEAKGLSHDYALREFVETVAIPFEQARQRQTMN